ncbi:hypothetical protein ACFVT5_31815 [Streptomyces sp. NPDC058001]|uniref:hypothetical protein n=1 Tax=Streptomyces sp. NPDC058001 TaxID=3346300 RepID=UPI0036EAF513
MSVTATTAQHQATGTAASDLLRTSLRVDSWCTAAFGLIMLVGGEWLSDPLGLPTTWSIPFGIAMLGGAAALALIAGYPRIPPRLGATVVIGNTLSCVAMLVLTFTGVVPLTGLGTTFMVVGALVVAAFADVEYMGLRRLQAAPSHPLDR